MSDIKLCRQPCRSPRSGRILEGVESGTFTADELRSNPDVVLRHQRRDAGSAGGCCSYRPGLPTAHAKSRSAASRARE